MKTLTKSVVLVAASVLSSACVPPHPQQVRAAGPSPAHGFESAGLGLGYLVLAPFMIAAGLLEGIASIPYFIAADLHAMNRAMVAARSEVSLDATYRYAYQTPLRQVGSNGDTGRVFRRMADATRHFRQVLRGHGVADPERYVLTAVRTADHHGYTLYAVIYRDRTHFSVRSADGVRTSLTPADAAWYRPYVEDADGRALDHVIDWAGVPRTSIRSQKGQAILLTLAANSVLINRRSDRYWPEERRWLAGEHAAVVAERKRDLDRRLGTADWRAPRGRPSAGRPFGPETYRVTAAAF